MLYDRIKSTAVTCNTTGNATWTAAASQYALPPSGITNKWVNYTLLDSGGTKWETGHAQLSESAGTYTLTRGGSQIVTESTNSGAAESFTNSSAHTLVLAPDAQFFNNAEILLEKQTASASASIAFDLPAGFSKYILRFREVIPVTDGTTLNLHASTDSGGTYLNTSGDYYFTYIYSGSATAVSYNNSQVTTAGILLTGNVGGEATEGIGSGEVVLAWMSSTSRYKQLRYRSAYLNASGELFNISGAGAYRTTSAVDNVKFQFASGNISSGTFKLYGIVE